MTTMFSSTISDDFVIQLLLISRHVIIGLDGQQLKSNLLSYTNEEIVVVNVTHITEVHVNSNVCERGS